MHLIENDNLKQNAQHTSNQKMIGNAASPVIESNGVCNGSFEKKLRQTKHNYRSLSTSKLKKKSIMSPVSEPKTDLDGVSDSSEELEYGPGIVNKLKTKYMSLTLRENQKRGLRPSLSNLRKSTSLDNLLEDEYEIATEVKGKNSVTECISKLEMNGRSNGISHVNGKKNDLKRATSVETLHNGLNSTAKYNNQHRSSQLKKPTRQENHTFHMNSIVNDDIVIIENTESPNPHSRKTSITDEFPRPDVVKETLKLFEGCKNSTPRASKSNVAFKSSCVSGLNTLKKREDHREVPNKLLLNGKPRVLPKPALPKSTIGGKVENLVKTTPVKNIICSSPNSSFESVTKMFQNISDEINNTHTSRHSPSFSKLRVTENIIVENLTSPVSLLKINFELITQNQVPVSQKTNCEVIEFSPTSEPKESLLEVSVNNTPTDRIHQVTTNVESDHGVCEEDSNFSDGIIPKDITQCASSASQPQNKCADPAPVRKIGIIRPMQSADEKEEEIEKNIQTVINQLCDQETDLDSSPVISSSQMHCGEFESFNNALSELNNASILSLDMSGPSLSSSVSSLSASMSSLNASVSSLNASISSLNASISSPEINASKPATLWGGNPWNQQQNTMVFNFSNRKDVPDYIENDGMLLGRYQGQTKNKSRSENNNGVLYLRDDVDSGNGRESSTDRVQEEWEIIAGPPSPCDIYFEGENASTGKSNLKKQPKEKKLRICFNDTCTTYEYPSEASLMRESLPISETIPPVPPPDYEQTINSRMHNLVGSHSSLSSYVPNSLSVAGAFELGVTKAVAKNVEPATSCQKSEEVADDEYLMPLEDDIPWSEKSLPDLLF